MRKISQRIDVIIGSVFTLALIIFLMCACSNNFSPDVPSIDKNRNDNESQSLSGISPAPSASLEETVSYFDYETIVINDILIGAWDGEKWMDADLLYQMLPEKNLYTVTFGHYDCITSVGAKSVLPLGNHGIVMENADRYNDPLWHWLDYIALSGDKNLFFWITNKEHPGNPIFQNWVNEVCIEGEYSDLKLFVRDVYSIDLNFGFDKIYFIIADNDFEPAEKGRVQFVRMPVDGAEKNLKLSEEFWDWDSYSTVKLLYVCDLNRDGEPEYITYTSGGGWGLYKVYAMQDMKYSCVLEAGWAD